jgi:hypothetical protein
VAAAPRIQEVHLVNDHVLCEVVETALCERANVPDASV